MDAFAQAIPNPNPLKQVVSEDKHIFFSGRTTKVWVPLPPSLTGSKHLCYKLFYCLEMVKMYRIFLKNLQIVLLLGNGQNV